MAALKRRKSPELGGGGALEKLATVEATNGLTLPQNTPTRQQICFDCDALHAIRVGRHLLTFCAQHGAKIRPDSPACSCWPTGTEVSHAG